MKTTTCLVMTAAMAAGCGDNASVDEPAESTDTVVPSAFVNGMPSQGVFAIVCDTRYTIDAGVFDCPNVEIEPGHYRQTCPDAAGDDVPVVTEIWYDDQQRTTHEVYAYAARTQIAATDRTYTYDDIGLRRRLERKVDGGLIQDEQFAAFTDVGNPLAATIDWPEIGNYPPSAHMTESYSYDDHDRLVDQRLAFATGSTFMELSFQYDDAQRRRTLIASFGELPGQYPASTGDPITEDVDTLGRIVQRTVPPGASTEGSVGSYFYDDLSRLKRYVLAGNPTGHSDTVITDNFYECE